MKPSQPPEIVRLVQRVQRRGIELRADRDAKRILFRPADRLPDDLALELAQRKWAVLRYLEERGPIGAILDGMTVAAASDVADVMLETFATRTIDLNEPDDHAARIALEAGERWLAERLAKHEQECREVEERWAAEDARRARERAA